MKAEPAHRSPWLNNYFDFFCGEVGFFFFGNSRLPRPKTKHPVLGAKMPYQGWNDISIYRYIDRRLDNRYDILISSILIFHDKLFSIMHIADHNRLKSHFINFLMEVYHRRSSLMDSDYRRSRVRVPASPHFVREPVFTSRHPGNGKIAL